MAMNSKTYQVRGGASEPKLKTAETKVAVVYYLSRGSQLEHPHFIQVPLSSPSGLYLRDVVSRLNLLRGHGMANMYSWSAKRSYRKGYVWQDLSEDDFIYPSHAHEYILKGSQIPQNSLSFESVSSSTPRPSSEINSSVQDSGFPVKQSWSSSSDDDRREEYKVHMEEKISASDVATQTGEETRQIRGGAVELKREEVSPPPASYSSSGRLDCSETGGSADIRDQTDRASGRIKASAVVMQLISCGSRRVDDWE